MELARRKLSCPQWWMCVWQHYNANMQQHIKDDPKKQQQHSQAHPSTRKMIHPTCASPKSAAERPTLLDLPQASSMSSPSLASMGSTTVLDLSNPTVLSSFTHDLVFTPNTERLLLTTLSEVVASQGLTAVSPAAITVISPSMTSMATTATAPMPIMVTEEGREEPASPAAYSMSEDGGESEYSGSSMSMDSMDPMVARAVRESSSLGSLTPLIKTELKCTIQKKRILAGKTELSPEVLLECKDKHEELSPQEEERRQRRRERNKLAAQKCRGKRKERATELEEEVSELEDRNAEFRAELERLEQEKASLKRLLNFHDGQEAYCPKRQRLSHEEEEEEESGEQELLDVLMDGQTEPFNDDHDVQIVI